MKEIIQVTENALYIYIYYINTISYAHRISSFVLKFELFVLRESVGSLV